LLSEPKKAAAFQDLARLGQHPVLAAQLVTLVAAQPFGRTQ